ncbi:hypothetical protein PIB30_003822 [Stylosanthes scabra]|uniref:Uncharacterized protein n=1 Tax=Stylosanthes scabra TaxID=79078 RepID=A0ABU6S442_9FABA|nr:hypothetical protein [Stylosanthes scabra]
MEAIRTTRKRDHPSASTRSGTFTRSRSQIFLHRSRSGLLRPDPQRTRSQYQATLPPSPCRTTRIRLSESVDGNDGGDELMVLVKDLKKKTRLGHEPSSTGGDSELSRALMKDLRARRVYSPPSSLGACSNTVVADVLAKGSGVDSDCAGGGIADLGFGTKASLENSGSERNGSKVEEESGNLEKAFSSEGQKKDEVNSILSLILNEYRSDKDSDIYGDEVSESSDSEKTESQDGKRSGGISSEKIEDSREELVQTTPPDTDISEVKGKQVEDTPLPGNALKNAGEGSSEKDSRRNGSVLRSKSVLKPRFQGKLFKAPGSVNFKRLFPYLKDIKQDDSGTEDLGHCQKDEKAMVGNGSRLPLSCQNQEPSVVSEGDAVVAPVNELSHGNGSELASSLDSLELDMQFHSKGVTSECLFVPSTKEVGNALYNDKFKKDSKQQGCNPDYAITANDDGTRTMEQFGVLDKECVLETPPDGDKFDKGEVNKLGQSESTTQDKYNVKAMDISKISQENAVDGFFQKVSRSNLHRKLFINPHSFGYKRLLPFLMDSTKDECDQQTHHKEGEVDISAKKIQSPLLSQNQGASIGQHKIEDSSRHDTDEHIEKVEIGPKDECLSDSKFDPHSVMDFRCPRHNSEAPPKAKNVLGIDGNVSNLTFGHDSSEEKGPSVDYGEGKPSESLENCKTVSGFPLEGQSVKKLDPNKPDAQGKGKRNHKICRSDDAVVLNHVTLLDEWPKSSPEEVIIGKSEMASHGAGSQKAGNVLKGIVYGSRMPSIGKNNKPANQVHEAGNSSEVKTRLVINGCSDMELLKQTASYRYKRLLPHLSNTMKDSSCATENDHCPKVQKLLDQTSSYLNMQATPLFDQTGSAPSKRCKGSPCDLNNDSSSPILEVPESKPSHNSFKVIQLQDEQVVSNGHCKPESSPSPRREKEAASVLSKPSETHGATILEQPRVSTTSFKRGILKRGRRRCRGRCTCLNCASFHLHAERAFEFSRNQFLDAEEVAHDLIKELSQLRKTLERSTESVNGNPILDGSEAKEACRKALVAEQLAKDRFRQMNDDLNIHCRISSLERPRVRFSNHVDIKVIEHEDR